MFLNIPDRIFFESETYSKMIQQNEGGLDWTFELNKNSSDHINLWVSDNKLNKTNYITISTDTKTDRNITIGVKLKQNGTIMYNYHHEIELLFENNATNVGLYYPKLKHFKKGDTDFKLNITNYGNSTPVCNVAMNNWDGFQSVGMVFSGNALVEMSINDFAPDTTWSYAVVRGHKLGSGTNLIHRTIDNVVKPITFTHNDREIEVIMKPTEKLFYTHNNTNPGGFGITSIQFYNK